MFQKTFIAPLPPHCTSGPSLSTLNCYPNPTGECLTWVVGGLIRGAGVTAKVQAHVQQALP